jgi:UDP-N-acetylglucosamine--N-acetylmuramyl-(pentapeptide) pyrophosphoryl-undecaprenol N-acetylglucosamine transferase
MIAITGGGTGGHLAIAKALKEEFVRRGIPVVYIGSVQGQDRAWFEEDGDFAARYFLQSGGVVDKRGLGKLASLATIAKSTLEARKILARHGVRGVVSVGGYSAAPASFGALSAGIPLFIHEQNAHVGRLNRLLRPFARRFFCSFLPPYDPYPVREIFYATRRRRQRLKSIIFLGGSQGASQINELALKMAPALAKSGVQIIHQCGESHIEDVMKAYEKMGIEAELFGFDPALHEKVARADLAIARSGASTVWELAANALPAIYLPYPYAAGDHQRHNALFMERRGGAVLYREGLDPFDLDLEAMSGALMELFEPGGAAKIADEILERL